VNARDDTDRKERSEVHTLTATDGGPHCPTARAVEWLETWSIDWYDPASRVGGAYRLRVDWVRGAAHANAWIALENRVTTHTESVLPPRDTGMLDFGAWKLHTIEPLQSCVMTGEHSDTEIEYAAFTDPFRFSMSGRRAEPGGEHYETVGTVIGTVRAGETVVDVTARGFYRHGWGAPDAATCPVQSVRGVFGSDLFFSVVEYRTATGRAPLGYLFEDGAFHGVEKARFRTETDGSGAPRGCDLLIATADRRDFRIPGVVVAQGSDRLGFGTFDLGRRRGTGLLRLHDRD
jgi:hypothetical protein